ncbi:hypothetical protein BANRA_00002 [Klebsiella pneumoniae]|nr:hypothetical protein BANRA_00002 [Klebsiella pneumoniae]
MTRKRVCFRESERLSYRGRVGKMALVIVDSAQPLRLNQTMFSTSGDVSPSVLINRTCIGIQAQRFGKLAIRRLSHQRIKHCANSADSRRQKVRQYRSRSQQALCARPSAEINRWHGRGALASCDVRFTTGKPPSGLISPPTLCGSPSMAAERNRQFPSAAQR